MGSPLIFNSHLTVWNLDAFSSLFCVKKKRWGKFLNNYISFMRNLGIFWMKHSLSFLNLLSTFKCMLCRTLIFWRFKENYNEKGTGKYFSCKHLSGSFSLKTVTKSYMSNNIIRNLAMKIGLLVDLYYSHVTDFFIVILHLKGKKKKMC